MIDTGDTAWMLTSTVLVLFMTLPGLALFYGGLVQARNVLSALMQCIAIACGASPTGALPDRLPAVRSAQRPGQQADHILNGRQVGEHNIGTGLA